MSDSVSESLAKSRHVGMGRFLKKLVEHEDLLEECFAGLVQRLRELLPGFGSKLAVDSTDLKAYADGHRSHPADLDARWGAPRPCSIYLRRSGSRRRPIGFVNGCVFAWTLAALLGA